MPFSARSLPDALRTLPLVLAAALAACGGGNPVDPPGGDHNVTISAITPDTLVEGGTGTITGTDFEAGSTVVTIDGTAAPITNVTSTSITFTVPASGCKPARAGQVVVTVGADASEAVAHATKP